MSNSSYKHKNHDIFQDDIFSNKKWSASTVSSPQQIQETINTYNLIGRKIKDIRFIEQCHNLTRNSIEREAYSKLDYLSREEREIKSCYLEIPADLHYKRLVTLSAPIIITLEEKSREEKSFFPGDTFEVGVFEQNLVRMSMNRISFFIQEGQTFPDVEGEILFSPCINSVIKDIEINSTNCKNSIFKNKIKSNDSKIEIILWCDNDVGLCIKGDSDFYSVCCINRIREIITIPFSELLKSLHNWEDLHGDDSIGFVAKSRSFFFTADNIETYSDIQYMSIYSGNNSLYISIWEFVLWGLCISDLFEIFEEYNYTGYQYTKLQWQCLLEEAEKLLNFHSFDELFEYRLHLFQKNYQATIDDYRFTREMNWMGVEFWKNRDIYRVQLEDMKKWTSLVLGEMDTIFIRGA